MEWLTGLNDDGYSRFHEIDEDNSQSIELGELAMALGGYLDVMGEGKFVELLEVARRNQERFAEEKEKKRLAAKKAKLQKARRETEFKEREEKRRLLNARELTSKGGHEKLNKVRHRLLAASYTSFGFGSDLAAMFAQFDKDGSGALDIDELKGVVRRNLHISQKEVSDFELETLFAFLDADNGGTIEMEEITKFLAHDLDENDDGAVVLPKHLQHIGERTAIEELTDLINFKTEKELQVDALEPMAPPGEIPWNHSTHSPRMRTTYQTTGIGVTFHRPQNY
jgi:Ca2+-binding EF-hand superfamily protein